MITGFAVVHRSTTPFKMNKIMDLGGIVGVRKLKESLWSVFDSL